MVLRKLVGPNAKSVSGQRKSYKNVHGL